MTAPAPPEGSTQIAPIMAIVNSPEGLEWLLGLSPIERMILPYMYELWLRPEQRILDRAWHMHGWITGRGWGKSTSIAFDITLQILARSIRHLGLMAPTEDRIDQVQARFLIDASPPWDKAETYGEGIAWPNGATATGFVPSRPGRPRGENLDACWLTEIVDWQANTRKEAFDNITTATRTGPRQVYWDTTSMGRNDVIQYLEAQHARDPYAYRVTRGTTFDNPLLDALYLRAECAKYAGRRYEEEILGRVFAEAAGASFLQAWLDDFRVTSAPPDPAVTLVAIDPALSDEPGADVIGLGVASLDRFGHVYALEDMSAHMKPEQWGDLAIEQHFSRGAAGAVIERNHIGDAGVSVLRARAKERKLTVRELPRHKDRPFPARTPGVFYVREYVAATSKSTRAQGPAAKAEKGYVHLVGDMPALENELTTYVPGTRKSPNRFDWLVYAVLELLDLTIERERPQAPDAKQAAEAESQLRAKLAGMGRGRIIGL